LIGVGEGSLFDRLPPVAVPRLTAPPTLSPLTRGEGVFLRSRNYLPVQFGLRFSMNALRPSL
jgi:hypothetical protein